MEFNALRQPSQYLINVVNYMIPDSFSQLFFPQVPVPLAGKFPPGAPHDPLAIAGAATLSNSGCVSLFAASSARKVRAEKLGDIEVGNKHHHDRDRRRGVFDCPTGLRRHRHDEVGIERDQLSGKRGQLVRLAGCIAAPDDQVLAFHVAALAQYRRAAVYRGVPGCTA